MDTEIRVIGISGSLRPGSFTRLALKIALEGAQEVGASARLLDLNAYHLTFDDLHTEPSPGVQRMRQDVRQAHGILLGTPEYHSSYSGILKHALDLMGFEEFEGKLVGLIGVAGGKMGAINALNSLRTVGRSLHAWVLPDQVSIAEGKKYFNEAGEITDARLENTLKELGRQVTRFAFLHHSAQAREFLRLWETAPSNPGGRIDTD